MTARGGGTTPSGMTQVTRLYLVRHGQTDLNRDRRFRGLTDAPLNDSGRAEAAGAASILKGMSIDSIHASPMPRTLETARIISSETGSPVRRDDRFTDIDYGLWQGLTVEEVAGRFGAQSIEKWRRDPGAVTFPGGDHMGEIRNRVKCALEALADEHRGGTAVVVTHMALLKVCFLAAMDLSFDWFWKIGIDNGSVSLFTVSDGAGFVLEWWNRPPGTPPG